jgi:hypothetical protein
MRDDEELFLIDGGDSPHPSDHYFTGELPDGRKLLSLRGGEGMLNLWFAPSGQYAHTEALSIPRAWDTKNVPNSYNELVIERLIAYQRRVGCKPADIRVRRFFLTEPIPHGIKLVKECVPEFLCNPY